MSTPDEVASAESVQMDAQVREAIRTLGALLGELRNRQSEIREREEYYEGARGKLVFASEEFAKYFAERYTNFSDNWCGVVADAPTERLEVTGFRLGDGQGGRGEVDRETWRVWRDNDADYYSDQAFLEAIINGRAYVLVWGDDNNPDTPVITWEHPGQAIVAYDPETRERRAGAKWWVDEWTGEEFATLYTPEYVYKFRRPRVPSGLVVPDNADSSNSVDDVPDGLVRLSNVRRSSSNIDERWWVPREVPGEPWPLPNPLGRVPLVEIRNRPRLLRPPMSDIAGVIAMQNAINLFWAYLLNAADYASFPQRVVMRAEYPKRPVLDDDGQVVGEEDIPLEKFAVDRVAWITDPNAQIGEWSAACLDIYTNVIETCVSHVAAQTRTPPHYLMTKIVNANAETLKTAETGLVKRTEEKTKSFGRDLRDMSVLVALAQNDERRARLLASGSTLWRDVEIRSEAQAVDAAQKYRAIGYPLEWISRRIGMDPEEIAEVLEMRRRELEMDPIGQMSEAVGRMQAIEPIATE